MAVGDGGPVTVGEMGVWVEGGAVAIEEVGLGGFASNGEASGEGEGVGSKALGAAVAV